MAQGFTQTYPHGLQGNLLHVVYYKRHCNLTIKDYLDGGYVESLNLDIVLILVEIYLIDNQKSMMVFPNLVQK